jgi:lipid-A-disaccharide synthase
MSGHAEDDLSRPFTVFLVAGEESGDQLGAGLMRALSWRLGGKVRFLGVGGERMAALGLQSLFPMQEIGLHGVVTVIARLGRLFRRRQETAAAVLSSQPDVLVTIDCPAFNLGVAKAVRKAKATITNVHYVMPSVWAYHPSRASKMALFIDHVLAVLPFEPDVSRKLNGPPCSYVGHLLIERLDELRPSPGERPSLAATERPTLLVLPGSRRSEIRRLIAPFGETVARIVAATGPLEVVVPAVPHQVEAIRAGIAKWSVAATIVVGEQPKLAAFRRAHAALAASGTVTLELALSGVPMVVAYRIDLLSQWVRLVFRAHSIVLANLVLGENPVPELVDWQSTPKNLAAALAPLLGDTPERRRQLEAFDRLDALMTLEATTPSARAADIVLATVSERQRRFEIGT